MPAACNAHTIVRNSFTLLAFIFADRIFVVRCKKVERHVTPVVIFLRVELKYRHQFNRRHAQLNEIRNLFNESGKGTRVDVPRTPEFELAVKPFTCIS